MSLKLLSLLPLVVGYVALSIGAWKEYMQYRDTPFPALFRIYWVKLWCIVTLIIAVLLPLLAFTAN